MMAQTQAMPGPDNQSTMLGIVYINIAMILYAIMDGASKWLVEDYNPVQILVIRSVMALIMATGMALGRGGWSVMHTKQPVLQAARGLAAFVCMTLAVMAYQTLPLADAISIIYSAPVLVTVLSIPFLGERVGIRRGLAVGVGFIGVLVIAQPGSGILASGGLLALGAMVFYASATVMTRKLGRTDRGITSLIYTQIAFLVCGFPVLIFEWVTPTWEHWLFFLLAGGAGAYAQYLLTQAYSTGQSSVLAPFDYTAIVWAMVTGFIVFGEVPSMTTWIGAGIVAASGLYIVHREFKVSPPRNKGPVYNWLRGRTH